MISYGTFVGMPSVKTDALIGTFGKPQRTIRPWEALKQVMEHTTDHVVFVVTKTQMPEFMKVIKHAGLEKYLVVRQDGPRQGTRNPNYPNDPRRLRHFILKGQGESNV